MKTEELKILLEKYYEGKTSEEEERILKIILSRKDVPAGFEAEKEIFGYYRIEKIPEPSGDFEDKIRIAVERQISVTISNKVRNMILVTLSVAAGILLLAGSYFFFVQRTGPGDTFSDPEIAYRETLEILNSVSTRLNRGAMALRPLYKMQEARSLSFKAIGKSATAMEENIRNLENTLNTLEIDRQSKEDGPENKNR